MELHVASDGRFKNIQEAYDHLTEQHKAGNVCEPSKIIVHDGCYVLEKPLYFYADLPVSIEAAPGEHPVVSGGEVITAWTRTKVNGYSCWKTLLPESVTEVPFFYVNGKAAQASRWPKKDFLRVQDERESLFSTAAEYDNFHIQKGDFNPKWYDPQNIWIRMMHVWIEETCRFESYDPEELKITTSSAIKATAKKQDTEFIYLNVREALSEPNEYYFDRNKHELLYISEDGKKPVEAVLPKLSSLVYIASGARWVTLKGLRFQYSGNYLPVFGPSLDLRDKAVPLQGLMLEPTEKVIRFPKEKPLYTSAQAATQVPGVILFDHASDCTVQNCEFTLCGRYGISVVTGCTRLLFENNEMHHLGGGGIMVYGNDYDNVMKNPASQVSHIIIRKNHIHDCGLFFYSATGITIRHAWGCLIEENHIHDLFYSGISCGWVWGYAPSVTHDIRICRNHIHDLGKKLLSDMGGVYLLGVQPGTRVWKNVISNIESRYYGGWGLYNDEGSAHIVLENNIVTNCTCQGYHIHYGRENIVRRNIFAFNKESGAAISRNRLSGCICPGEPHSKTVNFINNLILTKGTPVFQTAVSEMVQDKRFFSDFNILWDVMKTKDIPFAKEGDIRDYTLEEWREAGFDRHSIIADPGFRNAEKGDFRLKKNSILHDYGFTDKDFEK